MDELLAEFIAETRETLEPLAGEVVAWEAAPCDRARLDTIFRFVHTVKGSCGFLDLPRLQRLSHVAESALAQVRDGERAPNRRLVSAVLAAIDRIGELVEALAAGETRTDDDEALIRALEGREARPLVAVATPAERSPSVEEVPPPPTAPEPTALPLPPASATASSTSPAPRGPVRTIRLPVDLLDRMMAGVSDMVLARNELGRRLRERGGDGPVDAAFERLSACVAEMRESVTRMRMQRIDGLFSALPRMVRDLSDELGRQVQLAVDGGDVELDREMIEMIRDPLTHIVRNALDHGIESPADRLAAGKPAAGTLGVVARQSGNQILIEVADDGRGIDDERLLARALAAGIVSPERASRLGRAERLALIFAPGLSTAAQVTAISGRGVGMDVVRANIERIGGTVEIDTQVGRGCKLTLRVPMTLTIIPALTFSVGAHLFAIPRGAIDEIVRARGGSAQVAVVGGVPVARIRGERVPMVELAKLLEVPTEVACSDGILVVVRASSGERYALAVDQVQDHEELVVKPAAPAVMATGLYAGTTLPDNGRPMLLIDPAGVAQAAGVRVDEAPIAVAAEADPADACVPTLLFLGLDRAIRAVRLSLVERIVDVPVDAIAHAGGRLRLTHDGRILPLFGGDITQTEGKIRVLLLGDGTQGIAYAIAEVIDIHDLSPRMAAAAAPGPIAGVLLVDGRQVELIDCFWLFEQAYGAGPAPAERPLCLLDGSDAWSRDVLRPIVEQAGYRVRFDVEAGETPAVVILPSAAAESSPLSPAAPVIRLRATVEEAEPGSIYRYDRQGLAAALAAVRSA